MRAREVMQVRGYRPLLASYTINDAGDSLGVVALAILVYDETGDPLATAALFVAAKFLPAFMAPLLAARLDHAPPRTVLAALYTVEAAVFAVLALVAEQNFLLIAVLALALADGTLAVTARAITRGTLGALLKPAGLLRDGNAVLNIAFAVSSVGGAALGGFVVEKYGAATALYIDAASFALAAGALLVTRSVPPGGREREPLMQHLREGLQFVRRNFVLRALLTGEALALIFFTLVVPIEVFYAKETLDAGDAGLGLLLATWGVGIFIGSLLFAVSSHRPPLWIAIAATATVGAAYVGMSITTELSVACSLCVVGGIGNGLQYVSVVTSLQEETPQDLQTRVVALLESVSAGMPGVGFLLGGILVALADPPTAFAIAGVGVLLIAAAGVGLRIPARAADPQLPSVDSPVPGPGEIPPVSDELVGSPIGDARTSAAPPET